MFFRVERAMATKWKLAAKVTKESRGPFLESPENFLGPKS